MISSSQVPWQSFAPVRLVECLGHKENEMRFVAKQIEELVASASLQPRDVAILCRTNAMAQQARNLLRKLLPSSIPCNWHKFTGE